VIDFTPVADGVYVARTSPLDLNIGLIIGTAGALVVDTTSTDTQAKALVASVAAITKLPLTVLNTHAHFDHCFGNAIVAAGERPIWAHPNAVIAMREDGAATQAEMVAEFRDTDTDFADGIGRVTLRPADHEVRDSVRLDLGDRIVTVAHHGRGHTNGDLTLSLDDGAVLFTGDLVEQGAPPWMGEDSYPLDWPHTTAALIAATNGSSVIVPGHGARVDQAFMVEQHAQLAAFAWAIRDGHAAGATVDEVAATAPWPADECREGVVRGYALLDDPVDI
jgi:glyoxylase-like metal-dependent hydrolase (beta-lactamase superfamily II)